MLNKKIMKIKNYIVRLAMRQQGLWGQESSSESHVELLIRDIDDCELPNDIFPKRLLNGRCRDRN